VKVHDLKCWPREFRHVRDGLKPFEVRLNDRNFQEGDVVILREFVPDHMVGERIENSEYGFKHEKAGYTGSFSLGPFRIGYLLKGAPVPDGWCAFELIKLVPEQR